MSSSPHTSHAAARTVAAALAATLGLAACSDRPSPTSPMDESAVGHVQTSAASRLLVADVLDDAAGRLLPAVPAASAIQRALTSLRAASAGGDPQALTAALTEAERAIDDARALDAVPDADRDALSLHLLAVRAQLATLRSAR